MREFVFPTIISDSKVKAAADTYLHRVAALSSANRDLVELEGRRDAVVEEDRRSYAEALKADDAAAPAPVALRAFEEEVLGARRRAEALELLAAQAEAELLQVVEERRVAWAGDIDRQIERDRAALAKAVEALSVARNRLTETLATSAWLHRFPSAKAAVLPVPAATATVPLISRSGDPFTWGEVLAALRSFGAPAPVPERPVLQAAAGG